MPKKTCLVLLLLILTLVINLSAQTAGNVTFKVKTGRTFQNYDPRNVLAIWLTDDNNNFIRTFKKRANARQQYLYKWKASSNQNTVNAVTGATLNNHQTHIVSWDCTDLQGNTVPDGYYRVRCEFTTRNGQGPWTPEDYIRFYKGTAPLDTPYPDYTYNNRLAFSDMSLQFTPAVSTINSEIAVQQQFQLAQNYPNPFNPVTRINFVIHQPGRISLDVYNHLGEFVQNLKRGAVAAGEYHVDFNGMNVPSGIYYYRLQAGNSTDIRKMILLK